MPKWFYTTFLYKAWKRVLTWFGDVMFATQPPKVKAEHLRKLLFLVQRGDILCRRYNYYLDSYFIKGKYTHSGMCISNSTMIHAIAEGVNEIDVLDFSKDTEGFVILRPDYTSPEELDKAVNFAIAQKGKPYDFIFNSHDINYFYCHELTWDALEAGGVHITPKEDIVYANDIICSCKTIYETAT